MANTSPGEYFNVLSNRLNELAPACTQAMNSMQALGVEFVQNRARYDGESQAVQQLVETYNELQDAYDTQQAQKS
jgi:hypothetical protein